VNGLVVNDGIVVDLIAANIIESTAAGISVSGFLESHSAGHDESSALRRWHCDTASDSMF